MDSGDYRGSPFMYDDVHNVIKIVKKIKDLSPGRLPVLQINLLIFSGALEHQLSKFLTNQNTQYSQARLQCD